MRTNSIALEKLVQRIRAKQFEIPQFQRDFIWNESQVRLLVDSIARNYPVGSLLLTEKSKEIPLASRSIDAVIMEGDEIYSSGGYDSDVIPNASFVLDGQQRLTSIARVFLNAGHKRDYYFDLKLMYDEFVLKYSGESSDWIKSYSKSKMSPNTKGGGRLIRTDIALNKEDVGSLVAAYFEDSSEMSKVFETKDAARRATARINGVFETVRNYEIPFVLLNGDEGVDSICRVFETINSTGTKLTTFDLAVARYFSGEELNLRDMFESSIQRYPALGQEGFNIDGEKVLQVILVKYLYENERFIEPTRGKLLSLPSRYILENWDLAAGSLSKSYLWFMSECGVTPKNSPNQIMFTSSAAMFAVFGENIKSVPNLTLLLRRWFFSNAIQKGSAKASNYQIARQCQVLFNLAKTGKLSETAYVNISEEEIVKLNFRDNRYRALMCFIRMKTRYDMVDGSQLGEKVEEHHIFPRSYSKKHTFKANELDSICNLAIINQHSNNMISDSHPSNYIRNIISNRKALGLTEELKDIFSYGMLPDFTNPSNLELLDDDRYQDFLIERSKLILSKLRETLGDSLVIGGSDDGDEAYDIDN